MPAIKGKKREKIPHIDDVGKFGERLKLARYGAGMSQKQLAFPGCSSAYVSRVKRGERIPSLQVIRELAKRLNVDEQWLATGKLSNKRQSFARSTRKRKLSPNRCSG